MLLARGYDPPRTARRRFPKSALRVFSGAGLMRERQQPLENPHERMRELGMGYVERSPVGLSNCTEAAAMDVDAIHAYLAARIGLKNSERHRRESNPGSLCFGIFAEHRQVAFARAVTDRANIRLSGRRVRLEEHRGRGLARWFAWRRSRRIRSLLGLRRIVLATRNAHGLYERFGLRRWHAREIFMEINRPGIYLAEPPSVT